MGDRLEEVKGKVKKAAGTVTGGERLEAEGDAEAKGANARRQTQGAAREAGGTLKEGLGKLTGDETTEAEGTVDKLRGRADRTG